MNSVANWHRQEMPTRIIYFKKALTIFGLVVFALMCTGCAGFWDLPTTTSSTITSTTLSSGYFYLLDSASSQIVAYEIVSGALTKIASYAPPNTPLSIAVAPDNDFLFVRSRVTIK